jgi:uncharacterized protein
MESKISTIVIVCLLVGTTANSVAQNQKTMKTATTESKQVVQGFFTAFGKGDFKGVINSFHDSCTVIAIRDSPRNGAEIYGTYKGKDGAKTFLTNLGNAFDTKEFTVDHIIGEGDVSFASGKFTHVVKSTGKSFPSDWALKCVIKDDKIFEYHFYEDSAKFSDANRK